MQSILRTHVPDCDVWAFGSRARGTAKPMSDLDLVLQCSHPRDPMMIENLREAFDESLLPIKVDLVDWARTDDAFRNIIEQQKVILQQGQTT